MLGGLDDVGPGSVPDDFPERLDPPPHKNCIAYAHAALDKVSGKNGSRQKRTVFITPGLFIVNSGKSKDVKACFQLENISCVKGSDQSFLIQDLNKLEPDLIFEWPSDASQNRPSSLAAFLDVLQKVATRKIQKIGHPRQFFEIKDSSAPLKDIGEFNRKKINVSDKLSSIKSSLQQSTELARQLEAKKSREEQGGQPLYHGQGTGFQGYQGMDGGFDQGRAGRLSPMEGYSGAPVGYSAGPRTPPPEESPWQLHYSMTTHVGRPYWYNTVTGESSWTKPLELQGAAPGYGGSGSPSTGFPAGGEMFPPPPGNPHLPIHSHSPNQLLGSPIDSSPFSNQPPVMRGYGGESDLVKRAARLTGAEVDELVTACNAVADHNYQLSSSPRVVSPPLRSAYMSHQLPTSPTLTRTPGSSFDPVKIPRGNRQVYVV